MEFKRIQNKDTRLIIAHFVNSKSKTYDQYEAIERAQKNDGKSYNSSFTTTDNKSGNFIHIHRYN